MCVCTCAAYSGPLPPTCVTGDSCDPLVVTHQSLLQYVSVFVCGCSMGVAGCTGAASATSAVMQAWWKACADVFVFVCVCVCVCVCVRGTDLCNGNANVAPSANTPSGKVWVGGDKGLVDYAGKAHPHLHTNTHTHTHRVCV